MLNDKTLAMTEFWFWVIKNGDINIDLDIFYWPQLFPPHSYFAGVSSSDSSKSPLQPIRSIACIVHRGRKYENLERVFFGCSFIKFLTPRILGRKQKLSLIYMAQVSNQFPHGDDYVRHSGPYTSFGY